ncbi:MAG: hypothetical protein GY754_35610 [bacterium]|nr:hypothetical protein [bacterium]
MNSIFLRILLLIFLTGSCSGSASSPDPGKYPIDPITIKKPGNKYNETARFISGLHLPESSKLYSLTKTKAYLKYKNDVDSNWNRFFVPNMQKCSAWSQKKIPHESNKFILYPFSGPDVLHPLVFFSGASDIVMFGLEPTGAVPNPYTVSKRRRVSNLRGMSEALNFLLGHAYFITAHMNKHVGRNRYNSITGIMLFFLTRGGYTIADVNKIYLNAKGKVLLKSPGRRRSIPGVEIIFYKDNKKKLSRVRYFKIDVANYSKKLPWLLRYLNTFPRCSTILKSASYLLHGRNFSKIRSTILKRSRLVLQDDSGMPLKAFPEKTWKLSYHGKYHKPLPVFKNYYQKDLQIKTNKFSSGPIPFIYGYGFRYPDMTYHLLLAEKKKKTPKKNNVKKR